MDIQQAQDEKRLLERLIKKAMDDFSDKTDELGLPVYLDLSTLSTKTALELKPELIVYPKEDLPDEICEF